MRYRKHGMVLLGLALSLSALAAGAPYSVDTLRGLVSASTEKGWWHKTLNSMDGNRYMLSFESKDHVGKLAWEKKDLGEGKIRIASAMQLAKAWCDKNQPFGEAKWEVDTVTYRFRSYAGAIEYIADVTLKTDDYKTIDVIVLPNDELIAPDLNPKF